MKTVIFNKCSEILMFPNVTKKTDPEIYDLTIADSLSDENINDILDVVYSEIITKIDAMVEKNKTSIRKCVFASDKSDYWSRNSALTELKKELQWKTKYGKIEMDNDFIKEEYCRSYKRDRVPWWITLMFFCVLVATILWLIW